MENPSPGDIGEGAGLQEKAWNRQLEEDRMGNEHANTGSDQSEQAHGQARPNEQRDNSRGRRQ